MRKRIPRFESYEEEADFWDKTDSTEYFDESDLTQGNWEPSRRKCDDCGTAVRERLVDTDCASGDVTIHDMLVFHCPKCGVTNLSAEAKRKLQRVRRAMADVHELEVSGCSHPLTVH